MADFDKGRLGDYVDVAARIAEFRQKHPDGSLQPADPTQPYRVETIGDRTYVVVIAAAYRTPDDPRPGIGMAYEAWPGRTPYTKDSELMNAETSAWGRAIVAVLAADTKRGIATSEEIRNRQAERDQPDTTVDAQRAFRGFLRQIAEATTAEQIADVGKQAKAAATAGGINANQNERLAKSAATRLAELTTGEAK